VAVDQQILVAGTAAVPVTYTVPNTVEAALLCVNATIDGSGAPSNFLATVEIVSDGGVVVARCPCFTTIPAGGSAEVSWFRLRDSTIDSTPSNTPYEVLVTSIGGLILYWKLDDAPGSTVTVDKLGHNNGTIYGSVTLGAPALADGTSATYGAGMSGFKGGIVLDLTPQLMSFVLWIKTTSVAGANAVLWADTNAPAGRFFLINMSAAGIIFVTVYNNGGTAATCNATVPVNDGAKHCVGFTYATPTPTTGAGATGNIYIDGALDTSTALAMFGVGLSKDAQSFVLGAEWRNAFDDPDGINKFAGTLDEFALWNTTLTAGHMAAINTAGRVV
jgi:hypothetical protein